MSYKSQCKEHYGKFGCGKILEAETEEALILLEIGHYLDQANIVISFLRKAHLHPSYLVLETPGKKGWIRHYSHGSEVVENDQFGESQGEWEF